MPWTRPWTRVLRTPQTPPSPFPRAGGRAGAGGPPIALVAALSLALRAYNPLSLPMFLDEATYLSWALQIWDERTRSALLIPIIAGGKQPLFMWLAGGGMQVFSDPLVAGRTVSALAGALSAVGVYLAGRWLVDGRVGLLAGLLYALVPYNLFYDRLALVEALLNTCGVWAFALSVFVARRAPGPRSAALAGVALGVALGAALWTKMPALFMLPFPVLCALLLSRRGKLAVSATGFAAGAAVLAALALLLVLMPQAANLWTKANDFTEAPESLLTFPVDRWVSNARRYWTWIQAYLPAPLDWLLLAAVVWGFVRRTRPTLFLVGCWAAFLMPTLLLARPGMYESRYTAQGVFPLLLLAATLMAALFEALSRSSSDKLPRRHEDTKSRPHGAFVSSCLRGYLIGSKRAGRSVSLIATRPRLKPLLAVGLFLALMAPSLTFDLRLLSTPESAGLAATDADIFVSGWSAGYGFPESVQLVKQRATELTRSGQPVIVLGYFWWGHAFAGLKLYLRGIPGVFQYVDMHLAREPEGFMEAWKPHHVPILLVGNDSGREGPLDRLDQFERAVPQARRIGFFPKPGGQSSFRVYEVDRASFD